MPTRSRYRPKFFEQELVTIISGTTTGQVPDGKRIGGEAVGESLVGHVDKRHQLTFDDHVGDRAPFVF